MGCTQAKSVLEKDGVYTKTIPESNGNLTHSGNTGDDTFSEGHKDILRMTWKTISMNRQEKGISIFVQIFSECPDAKKFFIFNDLSGDDLLQNPIFRSHSLRFINVVDTTIQNLDALDVAIIPVLHQLGKLHGWMSGFLHEYLPIFMNSILHVFQQELGKAWTNEVADAWGGLAAFIALKVTEGYNEALEDKKNESITDTDIEINML